MENGIGNLGEWCVLRSVAAYLCRRCDADSVGKQRLVRPADHERPRARARRRTNGLRENVSLNGSGLSRSQRNIVLSARRVLELLLGLVAFVLA
jgi:hypothetical protein